MKQTRNFPAVTITKKGENWVKGGHPWVYAAEITAQAGDFTDGCIADVFSPKGSWLGAGLYNSKSKIAVRILSNNANEQFTDVFFERRVKYALDYRRTVMGDDFSACRLIFGEADGLPGVTVDRFSDILVAQILSAGMEQRKAVVYKALWDQLRAAGEDIKGIYERNDVAIRELEGMEQYTGWYEGLPHPESCLTEITENGVKYLVDVENGQKTGFFLDQKYNRREIMRLAKGKTVLDCFTHTGSFALNAAAGGAAHVTAVDISQTAVDMARKNAERNGLEGTMDFVACDVFDLLPALADKRSEELAKMKVTPRSYDFIILDPPAFTKSRSSVAGAERGYKEINLRAMKLLPRGGYLATCSCSHFMKEDLFIKMLNSAARDAGVQLKQIEARQQAPDHPVLWNVPETYYLKFYIFQVI